MSSLIGHAVTGAAIALAQKDLSWPPARHHIPLLALLAIAPDFDYLTLWLFGIDSQPRATHSLVFCLGLAAMAWALGRHARPEHRPPGFAVMAVAACSHLLLDLLVGVHPLPIFWPVAPAQIASPIGLLPSAAHISLTNYYLWRNLLVEMGVLVPMLSLVVAVRRNGSPAAALRGHAPLILPWLGFLFWSLKLHR